MFLLEMEVFIHPKYLLMGMSAVLRHSGEWQGDRD